MTSRGVKRDCETMLNGAESEPKTLNLFEHHISQLLNAFGDTNGNVIRSFCRDSDNAFTFKVVCPSYRRAVLVYLMVLSPNTYGAHDTNCWSDSDFLPDEVVAELESINDLKPRTLSSAMRHIIKTLAGQEAADEFADVLTMQVTVSRSGRQAEDSQGDEEETQEDEPDEMDLFGLKTLANAAKMTPQIQKALRKDFQGIVKAGYRPGHTLLSDGNHVISVSVAVSKLGLAPKTLNAWDSKLLEPGVRLIMLVACAQYPFPFDDDSGPVVRYQIGIGLKAKPSKNATTNAFRLHSTEQWTEGEFDRFKLSEPLSAVLRDQLRQIFLFRASHPECGIAGAELHINAVDGDNIATSSATIDSSRRSSSGSTSQTKMFDKDVAKLADEEELLAEVELPEDPFLHQSTRKNAPLIAFAYLLRRFILCPWFCLICHTKVRDIAAVPYVCSKSLCSFQFVALSLGPSLENEILHNSAVVDILISLAYTAAADNELPAIMLPPKGMEIRVPNKVVSKGSLAHINLLTYASCEEPIYLDSLPDEQQRIWLAALIQKIPKVVAMKEWLEAKDLTLEERKSGKTRKLHEMANSSIDTPVWKVLRWIIATNVAYLREIDNPMHEVQMVPKGWRQFEFLSGAPEKEVKLRQALLKRQETDANARIYPTLYAFHGSAVKNWHSILREGLHYKKITNARAFGHGVYFALDASTSISGYAVANTTIWVNAAVKISKCVALCEIVNAPSEFTSTSPHLVVPNLDFIQTRYLFVQYLSETPEETTHKVVPLPNVTFKPMDPKFRIAVNNKLIQIPADEGRFGNAMNLDIEDDPFSQSDQEILKATSASQIIDISEDDEEELRLARKARAEQLERERVDYKPFALTVINNLRVLPAPQSAANSATVYLSKEVKSVMAVQEKSSPLELGFYYDPGTTDDNLFHHIIEMVNFDAELPLAQDMKKHNVPGIIFEVLFPPDIPNSPPFFRVLYPRFLPFGQGGGGNVTLGGSICMNLLTSSGWLPSYNMESVLLQIRMAISSTEPRPARLARNWNEPYNIAEALEGFKRAARTHGWAVPPNIDAVAMGTA